MNASDILSTVIHVGTPAFYGVNATFFLYIIAKVVLSPVLGLGVKKFLEWVIKRDSNRNRSQLNQFYRDVKVFQEILQETEKSIIGTGDNYARQFLEKIRKNLNKCQKVCDQLESKSLTPSSSQQVEELDLLLRNSIHMTSAYLSASSAGMKADLRHLRAVVHNLQAGMCQLQVHEAHAEPNKVAELIVKELKPGILHVSWKETTEVDYYEVQYDRQTGHSIKVSSTQCLLDSMQLHFPSEKFYNICVRGVNGCGPGKWSESAVGKFTILPEQPRKPLAVHANSSTSIALVMEKPTEREGAKPVTHFVVEYHTDADKKCTKKVFPINNLKMLIHEEKEAVIINLKNTPVNTALTCHVLISHRNEDGDSLPCVDCIETDRITPDAPVGLKVTYRTTHGILIEWSNTNACTVDHYEVHWELNKHTVNTEKTKNCYAVEKFLDSNTSYLIKVRAVNRRFQKSEFTEIRAKTKSDTSIMLLFTALVSLSVVFIELVAAQYMPVLLFFAVLVAMIATFFFVFTKHARLMRYLLVLGMTGNVIIAVTLYLRYPEEFMCYASAAVAIYTLLLYSYREDTQLKHYMLEKNMVSTKLEEIQVTQKHLLVFHVIPPAFTLFWLALIECCKYFYL